MGCWVVVVVGTPNTLAPQREERGSHYPEHWHYSLLPGKKKKNIRSDNRGTGGEKAACLCARTRLWVHQREPRSEIASAKRPRERNALVFFFICARSSCISVCMSKDLICRHAPLQTNNTGSGCALGDGRGSRKQRRESGKHDSVEGKLSLWKWRRGGGGGFTADPILSYVCVVLYLATGRTRDTCWTLFVFWKPLRDFLRSEVPSIPRLFLECFWCLSVIRAKKTQKTSSFTKEMISSDVISIHNPASVGQA